MLDSETKQYLDNLPDDEFVYLMNLRYGQKIAKWADVTKEEYEKHCGKPDESLSVQSLEKYIGSLFYEPWYKAVPYWNNGGGIMDQISGRKPDGYRYQKCIGYDYCLIMGGDMIDYCKTRKCMEPYFNNLTEKTVWTTKKNIRS